MAYTATVENGKVIDTSAATIADSAQTKSSNDALDKEAFLQLLVAQMQYQDPLEPTSNTEYISQLATFSELEAMTNLNDSMSISRASQLVGKKVSIETTSASTGETSVAEGTVDYVRVEAGKAYLVIDEQPYLIDDLASVMDDAYWDEYQKMLEEQTSVTAQTIMMAIASLPEDNAELNLKDHKELIAAIRKSYDEISTEEKQQVPDEYLIKLIQAENRIAKLEAEQIQQGNNTEDSEGKEDVEKPEETTE